MSEVVKKPNRFSLIITDKTCDNCGILAQMSGYREYSHIDRYSGWVSCGTEECNTVLNGWQSLGRITKEQLIERYGDPVAIKRSSGVVETDWHICGSASTENIWIPVKQGDGRFALTKDVSPDCIWKISEGVVKHL
jgi:transcription elongation factor Elf1